MITKGERILKIEALINSYLNGEESEVSEAEFDLLWDELKSLTHENPLIKITKHIEESDKFLLNGSSYAKSIKKISWDNIDHNDPEQIKRQKSAVGKKLSPETIYFKKQTGVFQGSYRDCFSKKYITTLENCGCVDFSKRMLPCKHMYRLAYELGITDFNKIGSPVIDTVDEDVTTADLVKQALE